MRPRSVHILGVRVDDVTYQEACDIAEALIRRGGAHQFATVNPEFVMAAQEDEEFRAVLASTALNVPDGAGVVWAAGRRGLKLRQRVAGVDLMLELCALAARHRWRVFLLGAQPGVAERVAAALVLAHRGLIIAGTYAGSPRREEEMAIVARVRAARPQLLFVAYGAPAQDKWLARNLPLLIPAEGEGLGGIVGMGVGGAFDFVAGVQKRAPAWVQRANLEWLYRLMRQPWRWRRQTALVRFAVAAMLESF
ncbi:MAG: WecB/TagA/CpsF family glycosyltransferase [Thermoflexales bacterium]|nr:WecB/TagA/CpsF family glycosyltransferase [Thermoflexales bacterium]MDW8350409.1 WecB/TagA/CpsF family glycosyltransferase [Anaerolineae bacterium]